MIAIPALVLLQLLPLPPQLLGWVSPGSYALHYIPPPPEPWPWFPITVYVPDTQRGLVFLAGMSLLYATVFRDFQAERWRRLPDSGAQHFTVSSSFGSSSIRSEISLAVTKEPMP